MIIESSLGSGDEELCIKAFRSMDADDQHGASMHLREAYKRHQSPQWHSLLLELYAESRCTMCRDQLCELLIDSGSAPTWVKAEAEFNALYTDRYLI
jgi:hypothetical protein